MLLWLTQWLQHYFHFFRVFQYLTFRSIVAALTGLAIVIIGCPATIRSLRRMQIGQAIRELGPKSHYQKSGTPTMGGALILIAILASTLLWANLENLYVWVLIFVGAIFGLIGFIDDYRKVIAKHSAGLPARWKYLWQSIAAILVALVLYFSASVPTQTQLFIPFIKLFTPNLGWIFILLAYFVIVGSSNAVNLTDGLDGLALMPVVLVTIALGVFAYSLGNELFSKYLHIPYLPGVSEVIVVCSAIAGAGLGFLWYNTYPAEVFMGDVGSLSLGALLGAIAVISRQELTLLLMGGIFVIETLSVILQVGYFKMTRKRIFKMAPLHHHFELLGWPEPKVIVRFWIITVILVLIGLSTLKLR